MMRNLSAAGLGAENRQTSIMSHVHNLRNDPIRIAKIATLFMLPTAALGWWYYSLAGSVGAVMPLRTTADASSELSASEPKNTATLPVADGQLSNNAASSSSTNTVDLNVHSDSTNGTTVELNGEPIPVSGDGSVNRTIQNDNGKTTIDVNVNSSSSDSSNTQSSTNVILRSSSDVDLNVKNKEGQ